MKITHVLLRWYRSFNINYGSYEDRRHGVITRPWNKISAENDQDYRFIEIPIQNDITTIVGGNESGKSHLVSAINKVINGVKQLDNLTMTPAARMCNAGAVGVFSFVRHSTIFREAIEITGNAVVVFLMPQKRFVRRQAMRHI